MNKILTHSTEWSKSEQTSFPQKNHLYQENEKFPRVKFIYGYKEPASHHHENRNDFYHAQYFAAIDNVKETIKSRFD